MSSDILNDSNKAWTVYASKLQSRPAGTLDISANTITTTDISANGNLSCGSNYIKINNTKIYVQANDPGAVGAGSIWISTG